MKKKKKRVRVVKVTPNVEPFIHEVVLHVEAPEDPPPPEVSQPEFEEPKKTGFWHWLLG